MDTDATTTETISNPIIVQGAEEWATVSILASSCLLPRLPLPPNEGHEHESAFKDFYAGHTQLSEITVKVIISKLKKIERSQAAMRKHVVPLFLFLGEQEDGSVPWGSKLNQDITERIIAELFRIFGMERIPPGPLSAFFLRDLESTVNPSKTTFAHLLKSFRPTLGLKDAEWKMYPAAQHSFLWIMQQVEYPFIGEHLEGCILPSLNFFEDFEEENILKGIKSLTHVFLNVKRVEVKNSGWGSLVYEHLQKSMVYHKEKTIVEGIFNLLLKILKLLESDPHLRSATFTLYDNVLENALNRLEICDSNTRRIWLGLLPELLEVMGHATLHWNERLQRILKESIVSVDPEVWALVLKVVSVSIRNVWIHPLSEGYVEIILRILLITSTMPDSTWKNKDDIMTHVMDEIMECFVLLRRNKDFDACESSIKEILDSSDGKLHPEFIKELKALMEVSLDYRFGELHI